MAEITNTSCTDGVGPSRQTIPSEKREGKRTSSRTGQHRTSLPEPCCMHPTLQDLQHSPHFGGSQAPQEVGCSSPAKTTKRALPLSPTSSGCRAFLTPRNCEARTIDSGCSWSGFAFSGQWANQRGVHCQLCRGNLSTTTSSFFVSEMLTGHS